MRIRTFLLIFGVGIGVLGVFFSLNVFSDTSAYVAYTASNTDENALDTQSNISASSSILVASGGSSERGEIQQQEGAFTEPTLSDATPRSAVFGVPFYSQFADVRKPGWQKLSCGIASLAMLIEFYDKGAVSSVDALLEEGIASGAYIQNAGWSHRGLALLAESYGLRGANYDFSSLNMDSAFKKLEASLEKGPIIASVYYTFDPQSPIPHLVVVNGIESGKVYYNDPAEMSGGGSISSTDFKKAWKKRYITVRAEG